MNFSFIGRKFSGNILVGFVGAAFRTVKCFVPSGKKAHSQSLFAWVVSALWRQCFAQKIALHSVNEIMKSTSYINTVLCMFCWVYFTRTLWCNFIIFRSHIFIALLVAAIHTRFRMMHAAFYAEDVHPGNLLQLCQVYLHTTSIYFRDNFLFAT